jgi:hypothetical protein
MIFYYFIYYKLFKIASYTEKQWAKSLQTPEHVALISYTLLLILNYLFISVEVTNYIGYNSGLIVNAGLIFVAILFFFNYFLFVYKKKYLEIEKRFDNESAQKRNVKTFFFWMYVVISICVLFILKPLS